MTTWSQSVKDTIYFVEGDDITIGRSIPLNPKNGKAPYCIHQKPSQYARGVRCGVERCLCKNCTEACIPDRGRL
jgi:hypothetical protein